MTPSVNPLSLATSGESAARGMRRRTSVVRLALFEARVTLRGRGALAGIIGFAVASLVVTLLGLDSFRQLGLGAVGPAAVALLNLALLLPTAVALVVGAMTLAGEREGAFLAMLRARGFGPGAAVVAIWLAVSLSAVLAVMAGFGLAALVLASAVPLADMAAFATLLLVVLGVAVVAAAIGVMIGSLAGGRLQAALVAVVAWFVVAVGLDLLVLGLGTFTRVGEAVLLGAVVANPLEAGRVLALLALDPGGAALGPAGAFLVDRLGAQGGAGVMTAALAAWLLVPLLVARRATRFDG